VHNGSHIIRSRLIEGEFDRLLHICIRRSEGHVLIFRTQEWLGYNFISIYIYIYVCTE
jgi:hypothetical protein